MLLQGGERHSVEATAMAAGSQQIQRRGYSMDPCGGGERGGGGGGGGKAIPPDFRCPLSLELMSDPVIVASGQTYERAYIQQWLEQGNTTCPKTRQALTHTNLIPNYTVKALIASWCEGNNVPLPEPARLQNLGLMPRLPGPVSSGKGEVEECISAGGEECLVFEDEEEEEEAGAVEVMAGGERNEGSGGGVLDGGGDYLADHSRTSSGSSVSSSQEEVRNSCTAEADSGRTGSGAFSFTDFSREMDGVSAAATQQALAQAGEVALAGVAERASAAWRRRGEEREHSMPRIVPAVVGGADDVTQQRVESLVEELKSDDVELQRLAASELRLLAKYKPENRITIANCGAIRPLIELLKSTDVRTQENAVTALLNLSINDINKSEIAAAGAIDPLVDVLKVGSSEAMENAAATLFSLSVMDDNKAAIGASGAIPELIHLLIHGSPRGKKDAATALFNLSIHPENKARIVRHGAVRPLVELMADPAAGMVDKAVAVIAILATVPEGKVAIGEDGGIPALVEVVEAGSPKGKENAAAALLQLCTVSNKHRALVLQEGAVPPLHALSQTGTARAKEKASALLRLFREQRHGRGVSDRMGRHF